MSRRAPSTSMCPRRSWPGAAPNGSRPHPATSAATAGCLRGTSGRPTRDVISTSSRRISALPSPNRPYSSASDGKVAPVFRVDRRASSLERASDWPEKWSPLFGPMLQHREAIMNALSSETREKLKGVSTATLCTALFKRGLRNQFIQDVRPLNPQAGAMVGEAFTLRYIPAREDLNPLSVFQDRNHPQRKAVEECPPGAVLVIDSRKDARAASAGSILVSRLMKRGVAGVVTDGGFRDSPEIAGLAIPAYHNRPSAPTNLSLHQALDINVPIGCGDVAVFPGDVVVGDAEGAV